MVGNDGVTEFEFVGLLRLKRGGGLVTFSMNLSFSIDFIK